MAGLSKAGNKKDNKKENKRRKWKVGDYCRALYPEDNLFYEAKVISLNGDFCTVEFLGYGDTEDIDLLQLKESEGKNARRKQVKASTGDSFEYDSSIDESAMVGDTTDATVASCSSLRKKNRHLKRPANNTTLDTTMFEATYQQQYPAPHPSTTYFAPRMPTSMPFMPPAATMHQHAVPHAPPMPVCPSLARDRSFASMLSAWYMAGYYTGIHSAQKGNHGCQCCCSHSNKCCH